MLAVQLFATKLVIAGAWQTLTLARMDSYMVHAEMTAMSRDRMPQFKKVCYPWMEHFLLLGV